MSEQRSFRSNTPEGCFPANADSITENALKDLYVKLLSSYKSSNQEKLILMENAKKDKMLIQELKNENELLRQTIETEKIKCEFLDKKAKESNSLLNKTLENAHQNSKAEAVNDVIKNLKTETEKYKRDLVLAQAIANNFKTELENLKILNENFKSENDLLNENLKDAKSHLDRSLLKRKELENEIQKLNFDLEKIKKENLQLIEGNKIKSASFFEKFKELSLKYESNNEATLTRHADITKLNEKLACDIEKLKKQLEINEGEKKEILSELTFERENVSHMQKDIDEKEDLIVKLQKDCKELIGEIRLLQEEAESFRNNCSCAELLRIKEEKEESLELLKNQIQNQKNEAFVEKSNFEDNLNSQKKAIEELNKEIKAGLLERNKLEKEIEMLKSKLDIAECSTKNFSEYKSIFETEMLVLKESIEKLQHEKEMLVSSRNSTQNDFNQLSNQYNFLKERLEKEIKLKNEEITEHEKNVESLKKEIAKLKENKKNLHFKSLNDEDIVTNLQSKITELEVREKEYKAKLNDIEGINFEKSNLQKSIDESRKIIAYLENQIKEHKGKTENLMRENSDLKSELTRLNTNQSTLQKEQNGKLEELNKKIIDDLNKEIKKINDLNMNLSKEKETLMSNSFNYKMEINSKQEMLEKIFKENKNLNEFVLELQSGSLSFFSELKIILNKLFSVVKRDNKSIFTQEAFERLNDLITQMNQLNKDNIETESLFDLALNALNSLYEEVDHVYHKFLEAENILCQTNSINQVDKMTIERGEIENEKLINYNKELLNEISFYKLEIEKYKEQQKAMNSQLNNIRKTELIESNTAKSKLEEKVKSLTKDLSESKVDYSKVKNEYEIIMNEKKKLEDFLSLVAKNFPSKTITKMIFEFLTISEFIRKNELENKKIQERILVLEQELNNLNKEKAVKNSDLIKNLKVERDNLKTLIKDYEKKISDKKEQIKTIEKDLINQLLDFKNNIEKNSSMVLSNENNDFDKKSVKEIPQAQSMTTIKNASLHSRNNSEINFNREKNLQNSSLISSKTNKNQYSTAIKIPNLNYSNYAKSNAFSTYSNDCCRENDADLQKKIDYAAVYEPNTFKTMSIKHPNMEKLYDFTAPVDNFNEYKMKFEDKYIKNTPDRQRGNNKSSISNLEITSIESLNNINLENFNSGKSSTLDLNMAKSYKNREVRNNNIYENLNEEQIINNEVYDFNIRKNLMSQLNRNNNNSTGGYNLTFKNDYEDASQDYYGNTNLNYKKENFVDNRNKFDTSLEDLMNMKSNEFYKDNSLYLNSETKFNSGYKDSIDVFEGRRNLNDFDNSLLNSNRNFQTIDKYSSYK